MEITKYKPRTPAAPEGQAIEPYSIEEPIKISEIIAGGFVNWWDKAEVTLTVEEKDTIGRLYLAHIIGADAETIEAFIKGDFSAARYVGLRQCCAVESKNDEHTFWKETARLNSQIFPVDGIDWLVANSHWIAPFFMLLQISPYGFPDSSPVIDCLRRNAHVYK